MNYLKLLTLHLLLLAPTLVLADGPFRAEYDWDPKPVLSDIDSTFNDEEEVISLQLIFSEIIEEDDRHIEYYVKHMRTRVNSDAAVEANNRIYLPIYQAIEVVELKARVIGTDGSIQEVNSDDIKTGQDEDTGYEFQYFAMEGVTVGSEVEYLFKMKKRPSSTGQRVMLQGDTPIQRSHFELITPWYLIYGTKSYNGLPDAKIDTVLEDRVRRSIITEKVPKLKKEYSAHYRPHLQQLIYKLDESALTGVSNVNSFGLASREIYQGVYLPLEKKQEKAISKLVKEMNITASDTKDQVLQVENYLKSNFAIVDDGRSDELNVIESIIANKAFSEMGALRVYGAILDKLDIDFQTVYTSDRSNITFDPDFEHYMQLDKALLYITDINLIIDPNDAFSRLNLIDPNYTNCNGLFIKRLNMGNYDTGLGEIGFIEESGHEQNASNMNIEVVFAEDFDEMKILLKQEYHGLNAKSFQPLYDYLDEERSEEMTEFLVKQVDGEAEILDMAVENKGGNLLGVKPLIIKSQMASDRYIEQAGNNIIFKVGELIGRQTELYEEKDRQLDIEGQYPRSYHRKIRFNIPKGYKINNQDDLIMDYKKPAGKSEMVFTSEYKVDGDIIEVNIIEYYDKSVYPVAMYEDYRTVINAAADFNKITLIFEKE